MEYVFWHMFNTCTSQIYWKFRLVKPYQLGTDSIIGDWNMFFCMTFSAALLKQSNTLYVNG
jgi:hypothetical protein